MCLVFGLGGSNGQVRIQILAFMTSFLIYGWDISFSMRIPLMSLESSKLPPVFPWTLIRSKLTSFLAKSATSRTASTAILANYFLLLLTHFEPKAIQADSINLSWLSSFMSISSEISSNLLTAISLALSYPSAICKGCKPLSIRF